MERLAKLVFFIGLLVYFLVTVVARTPAEWGAWVAIKSVPGLSLTGVSGTLWSGRAGSAQVERSPSRTSSRNSGLVSCSPANVPWPMIRPWSISTI